MATNSDNVLVGVTGAIYKAPAGTTLPTSAYAALDVAFKELGFVTEEGVTEAQSTQVTNLRAWQNGTVVRKVQTEHDVTYQFTLMETNPEALEAYYGNYATASGGGKVEINAAKMPRECWVVDVIDDESKVRIVIPAGEVTTKGQVAYVNGNAATYSITLTAYEDPAYAGSESADAKAYVYYDSDGTST